MAQIVTIGIAIDEISATVYQPGETICHIERMTDKQKYMVYFRARPVRGYTRYFKGNAETVNGALQIIRARRNSNVNVNPGSVPLANLPNVLPQIDVNDNRTFKYTVIKQ
jgi:hypothetical protein